ncbi:MAG TPA: hypothetical protein DDZ51_20965 [Planctomycetaceae bacterium]|nr:hypothetical protein [Planctomycetaceae bacterium]
MSGAEAISLKPHSQRTNAIAVSPDGSRIVTVSDDGRAMIWDASKHELSATIVCEMPVTSAVWINDRQLAVGTGDWRLGRRGAICTYSLDGQFVGEMEDSRHFINDLVSQENHVDRRISDILSLHDQQAEFVVINDRGAVKRLAIVKHKSDVNRLGWIEERFGQCLFGQCLFHSYQFHDAARNVPVLNV